MVSKRAPFPGGDSSLPLKDRITVKHRITVMGFKSKSALYLWWDLYRRWIPLGTQADRGSPPGKDRQ